MRLRERKLEEERKEKEELAKKRADRERDEKTAKLKRELLREAQILAQERAREKHLDLAEEQLKQELREKNRELKKNQRRIKARKYYTKVSLPPGKGKYRAPPAGPAAYGERLPRPGYSSDGSPITPKLHKKTYKMNPDSFPRDGRPTKSYTPKHFRGAEPHPPISPPPSGDYLTSPRRRDRMINNKKLKLDQRREVHDRERMVHHSYVPNSHGGPGSGVSGGHPTTSGGVKIKLVQQKDITKDLGTNNALSWADDCDDSRAYWGKQGEVLKSEAEEKRRKQAKESVTDFIPKGFFDKNGVWQVDQMLPSNMRPAGSRPGSSQMGLNAGQLNRSKSGKSSGRSSPKSLKSGTMSPKSAGRGLKQAGSKSGVIFCEPDGKPGILAKAARRVSQERANVKKKGGGDPKGKNPSHSPSRERSAIDSAPKNPHAPVPVGKPKIIPAQGQKAKEKSYGQVHAAAVGGAKPKQLSKVSPGGSKSKLGVPGGARSGAKSPRSGASTPSGMGSPPGSRTPSKQLGKLQSMSRMVGKTASLGKFGKKKNKNIKFDDAEPVDLSPDVKFNKKPELSAKPASFLPSHPSNPDKIAAPSIHHLGESEFHAAHEKKRGGRIRVEPASAWENRRQADINKSHGFQYEGQVIDKARETGNNYEFVDGALQYNRLGPLGITPAASPDDAYYDVPGEPGRRIQVKQDEFTIDRPSGLPPRDLTGKGGRTGGAVARHIRGGTDDVIVNTEDRGPPLVNMDTYSKESDRVKNKRIQRIGTDLVQIMPPYRSGEENQAPGLSQQKLLVSGQEDAHRNQLSPLPPQQLTSQNDDYYEQVQAASEAELHGQNAALSQQATQDLLQKIHGIQLQPVGQSPKPTISGPGKMINGVPYLPVVPGAPPATIPVAYLPVVPVVIPGAPPATIPVAQFQPQNQGKGQGQPASNRVSYISASNPIHSSNSSGDDYETVQGGSSSSEAGGAKGVFPTVNPRTISVGNGMQQLPTNQIPVGGTGQRGGKGKSGNYANRGPGVIRSPGRDKNSTMNSNAATIGSGYDQNPPRKLPPQDRTKLNSEGSSIRRGARGAPGTALYYQGGESSSASGGENEGNHGLHGTHNVKVNLRMDADIPSLGGSSIDYSNEESKSLNGTQKSGLGSGSASSSTANITVNQGMRVVSSNAPSTQPSQSNHNATNVVPTIRAPTMKPLGLHLRYDFGCGTGFDVGLLRRCFFESLRPRRRSSRSSAYRRYSRSLAVRNRGHPVRGITRRSRSHLGVDADLLNCCSSSARGFRWSKGEFDSGASVTF